MDRQGRPNECRPRPIERRRPIELGQARSIGPLLPGHSLSAGTPGGRLAGGHRRVRGHVEADRVSRSAGAGGRDRDPAVERGRQVGHRRRRVPAAAAPDPRRGGGLLHRRAPDRAVGRSLRARHGRRVPEAGGDPPARRGSAPGADDRHAGQPPAGRAADPPPPTSRPRLGGAASRGAHLRRRHV